MLVLTQKVGEAVYIGSRISVRVLAVDGDYVRVGFEAPSDVDIIRGTLDNKLKSEGKTFKRATK